MAFQAKHPGHCSACGERIRQGEYVRYEDDFLVHDDCPADIDPERPGRQERKCPDCFTIHAGECF